MKAFRKNKYDIEIQVGKIKIEGTFSEDKNKLIDLFWIHNDDDMLALDTLSQVRDLHKILGELIDYLDENQSLIETLIRSKKK